MKLQRICLWAMLLANLATCLYSLANALFFKQATISSVVQDLQITPTSPQGPVVGRYLERFARDWYPMFWLSLLAVVLTAALLVLQRPRHAP